MQPLPIVLLLMGVSGHILYILNEKGLTRIRNDCIWGYVMICQ